MRTAEGIEIHHLAVDDAAAVLALVRKVLATADTVPTGAEEFTVTEEQEREFIQRHATTVGSLALGAFDGESLVGCLFLERNRRRRMSHCGEFGMSVDPDCWNRRIGSALVAAMVEQVKKDGVLSRVQLSVLANNPYAERIYQKHGFLVEGRRKQAVCIDGEMVDEIVMGLVLSEVPAT